jgi:hypothetical protein
MGRTTATTLVGIQKHRMQGVAAVIFLSIYDRVVVINVLLLPEKEERMFSPAKSFSSMGLTGWNRTCLLMISLYSPVVMYLKMAVWIDI